MLVIPLCQWYKELGEIFTIWWRQWIRKTKMKIIDQLFNWRHLWVIMTFSRRIWRQTMKTSDFHIFSVFTDKFRTTQIYTFGILRNNSFASFFEWEPEHRFFFDTFKHGVLMVKKRKRQMSEKNSVERLFVRYDFNNTWFPGSVDYRLFPGLQTFKGR